MSTAYLHAPGYPGAVEDNVPIQEFHRAHCDLCGWESGEFDALDWQSAEAAAVEHYESECPAREPADEDEENEEDG